MEKEMNAKIADLCLTIDQKTWAALRQSELLMAKYKESGDINNYVLSYELLGKAKGLALAQRLLTEELDKEFEGGEE